MKEKEPTPLFKEPVNLHDNIMADFKLLRELGSSFDAGDNSDVGGKKYIKVAKQLRRDITQLFGESTPKK